MEGFCGRFLSPPPRPTTGEGAHTGFSGDPIGIGVDVLLLVPVVSIEPIGGSSPNLHGYIIRASLRAD